jgi:hypothetical protein
MLIALIFWFIVVPLGILYVIGDVSMRRRQDQANKTIIAAGKQRGIK